MRHLRRRFLHLAAGALALPTLARLAPGTSATFGKFIADESEKWGNVVRFAGIKAE